MRMVGAVDGLQLARRTAMGLVLILGAVPSVSAQTGTSVGMEEEVRQLSASVSRLVALVEGWTLEAGRSERLRQVDELDRSIAFLDGELRARTLERGELEARLEALLQAMDRTQARIQEGGEPGFLDLLEAEADPESRLVAQERLVGQAQQSMVQLDARVEEIEGTLAERRDMRRHLASRLQQEITADRAGSR